MEKLLRAQWLLLLPCLFSLIIIHMLDSVIQKKINELPEKIRHAVENFDWSTEILHIAEDHNLQIDDVEVFHQQTLLVIVGLAPAIDFKKNLTQHMGISPDLAQILVDDANEHIFRPLQKSVFSHDNKPIDQYQENINENEKIIPHEKISSIMSEHGIDLIDENEEKEITRPKNELQDLADDLFNTKKQNDLNTNTDTDYDLKTTQANPNREYQEPIEDSDLSGIKKHRIDTSILKQSQPENISEDRNQTSEQTKLNQRLENEIFKNSYISKNEKIDVSPSQKEQIIENGDFLKHIGVK